MLKIENKKIKLSIAAILIIGCVYLSAKYLLPLIIPFVIAYMISCFLNPVAGWMTNKFHMKKSISSAIVLLFFIAAIGLTGSMILFKLFKQLKSFIFNWSYYDTVISGKILAICTAMEKKMGLADGSILSIVRENLNSFFEKAQKQIMPTIMDFSLPALIGLVDIIVLIVIILVSAFFMTKDMDKIKLVKRHFIFSKELNLITSKLSSVGSAYLRAQLIIMSITSVICFLGLKILNNPYAMLLGVIFGLLDALPLLGIGILFIPWAILYCISGYYMGAFIIFATFLVCYLIREFLEPKLIGKRVGIHPLTTIISMYIGYKLFELIGVLLGPICYIIIAEIIGEVYSTLYKRDKNVG